MKVLLAGLMTVLFSFSAFADHHPNHMTMQDVLSAQQTWGEGIVQIGEVFQSGGDYVTAARQHIELTYDYANGPVLFKPTLASETPFRTDLVGALSYFVGGNTQYKEDSGFAIKPWTNVRFENSQVVLYNTKGIAMGHYYFSDLNGKETKVEYTLGFVKRPEGVKIFLQDSSLPYSPSN